MATVAETAAKYGATYTPPSSSLTPIEATVASKYGAIYTPPPTAPKSSIATDWFGIKNPDTYFQDSLAQAGNAIMHPINTVANTGKAVLNTFADAGKSFVDANTNVVNDLSNNDPWAKKTADLLHSIGADAAVVFSPISAAFAAAAQVPVLKQAADVLQAPFAVTGKIGDFATESFIKALPIDQASKDVLAPAFGEIGSLAGQILLGGRVMSMISKGIVPDKVAIDSAVKETQQKVQIAEQHAQSPEVVANKYGATYTAPKEVAAEHPLTTEARKYSSAEEFVNQKTFNIPIDELTPTNPDAKVNFEKGGRSKSPFEPLQVILKDGKIQILNGNHRYYDALSTGKKELPVSFTTEPRPSAIDIKSQLTDIYNKANETATSGLAKSIEAKAVEAGLTPKLEKLAGYESSTIKEQAKIFADTINNKGVDEARAILRGEKPLPEGQKSFPFIVAMEDYLKKNPSADLAHELANSPHVSAASEAASNLGLGQNRVQDSFTKKIDEIKQARQAKVKNGATRETTAKNLKTEANKVNLGAEDLGKIDKFIESLIC